jgi:hypothetical protein
MGRPTSRHSVRNGGSSSDDPPFDLLWLAKMLPLVLLAAGCSTKQPTENTYFDRTISPIIQDSCVHTNTGANCHFTQPKGNAIGNLSLESYEDVVRRRDLLVNYGPYGLPNMLLKNVDPFDILLTAYDGTQITVKTDIRHSGVKIVGLTTAGFNTLKKWIQDGANKNNAISPPVVAARDECSESYPSDPDFKPDYEPTAPDFSDFKANVQPILGDTCAAGNCHGSPTNSLRLVCATSKKGNSDVLARWNYFAASEYLATTQAGLGASEILRRPLDPQAGGAYHEGGAIFSSQSDAGYTALLNWANAHGPNMNVPSTPGFKFFATRVQPMLVKKGCMILGCHSPAMFHDFRLRGGSGGNFSLPTTLTNYELTRAQIAMESPNPNASRLIAKNLVRPDEQAGGRGIMHRGGALFDDFGVKMASPETCKSLPDNDPDNGPLDKQHAYCVIARWIQIEQENAKLKPLSGMIYVKRKPVPGADLPQDYATFVGGSDLCFTGLSMDAMTGAITPAAGGACTSILAGCTGLTAGTADIRHPTVSWKADKIAFAARSSAADPYAIYTANIDATGAVSGCAKDATIAAAPTAAGWTDNGAPIHNFDPVFTPDDRIVFASTRGNIMNTDAFDYHGPTRTPADPMRWNANLYILEGSKVRQLTFLLNQEFLPSMMSDGRVIFTAEKRAPEFYQLAGRRMNLDGGDYHPLFGQRRTVGFDQMTEVVELANKNLATIFSDQKAAHGAGTLGIINRSLGPDQVSSNPADYVSDPGAIGWPAPNFYVHSLHLLDGAATGHTGGGNAGAYRSPAALPNGNLLVSYAANAMDLSNFTGNFDIYIMDEIGGGKTQVTNDPQSDELFPVAVYQRMDRGVFKSRPDEANANTRVYNEGEDADHPTNVSDVTILNAQILGGLIFQNTRTGLENPETGRVLPALTQLEVYEDVPPNGNDVGTYTANDAYGSVFAHRRLLGAVGVLGDGSARMVVPGGLPIVLRGAFVVGGASGAPYFQREEMQFYPGEYSHQGFQQSFFNGLCAGCHGSVSGREVDIALQPDILTQASRVQARDATASVMGAQPGARGPDVGP